MTALTSSNALEGPHRRSRLSARNRLTNSCCAGAPHCGAAEERLNEVQEEYAVVVQEELEAVDKVNENEVPSNELKGLCRQARSSVRSSIEQSYISTFIIHMVCMLVQVNAIY